MEWGAPQRVTRGVTWFPLCFKTFTLTVLWRIARKQDGYLGDNYSNYVTLDKRWWELKRRYKQWRGDKAESVDISGW